MKHTNFKDYKKRISVQKYELILLQQKISKRLTHQFLENQQTSSYNSRIKTRELGLNGLINGLKKVSW